MIQRIKICGLRDVGTAVETACLGADAIGLVFYAPSPRAVDIDTAGRIARALPPFVSTVGLFVDAEPGFVRQVLGSVPLDPALGRFDMLDPLVEKYPNLSPYHCTANNLK